MTQDPGGDRPCCIPSHCRCTICYKEARRSASCSIDLSPFCVGECRCSGILMNTNGPRWHGCKCASLIPAVDWKASLTASGTSGLSCMIDGSISSHLPMSTLPWCSLYCIFDPSGILKSNARAVWGLLPCQMWTC